MARGILVIVLTSFLALSCGGGQTSQVPSNPKPSPGPCSYPAAPADPTSADPWYGTVGNALVSDCGYDSDGIIDYLWIGFNRSTEWQGLLNLETKDPAGFFVCGQVVVLPSQPLGFYFSPDTTSAAEVTAEGIQTSIDQIKSDPARYTRGPILTWCVPARVERILAPSS